MPGVREDTARSTCAAMPAQRRPEKKNLLPSVREGIFEIQGGPRLPLRPTPTPTKRDGAVAKQQGAAGSAFGGSLDNGPNRGLSCAAIAASIIEKVRARGHCPVWGCSAASVLNRSEQLQATDNDDIPTWKQ